MRAQLERLAELKLVGNLVLVHKRLLPLTLAQLLKALCVPFVRTPLPRDLKQILATHGIKCRNHLALAEGSPGWHPFFLF